MTRTTEGVVVIICNLKLQTEGVISKKIRRLFTPTVVQEQELRSEVDQDINKTRE
jgi:hypothetical protein